MNLNYWLISVLLGSLVVPVAAETPRVNRALQQQVARAAAQQEPAQVRTKKINETVAEAKKLQLFDEQARANGPEMAKLFGLLDERIGQGSAENLADYKTALRQVLGKRLSEIRDDRGGGTQYVLADKTQITYQSGFFSDNYIVLNYPDGQTASFTLDGNPRP